MIAVPGLTPTFPKRVVGPVFVTVEAPRTAKFAAVPKIPAGLVVVTTVDCPLEAVAEMSCPSGTEVMKVVLKLTSPTALVVTFLKPRNVCPSP